MPEVRASGENPASSISSDPLTIRLLISKLGSNDGRTRQDARTTLAYIGKPAVGALMEALRDPNWHIRWEAAKALGHIHDPVSAPALVDALEDKDAGVRWLAGEALVAIGHPGLPPLLRALIERSESTWLREGAHHVVCDLSDYQGMHDWAEPVLCALEDIEPEVTVPRVAQTALEALDKETK